MIAFPPFEQEIALRQVLRLVDLSCDLERNQDDGNFARDRGKILYVLDENLFEMFIRPFRHREAVETFYANVWSLTGKSEAYWQSFEAQAALITSEYIVCGNLPGAETDAILMTEQHRWELADRVETLAGELKKSAQKRGNLGEDVGRKFEIITILLRAAGSGAGDFRQDGGTAPLLDEDMERLSGLDPALLRRIHAARVAAAFLAEDEIVEPLDQLRRITTCPIRGRLQTVQTKFRQARLPELQGMEADAERWFRRFVRELRRPGHAMRDRAQEGKQGRNLWNDARSVAYLRWLAKSQLRQDQRLAFVTADQVLFDAYRRWYFELALEEEQADDPHARPSPGEPFFMRRAVQFSPIFNPFHSGGDLTKSERVETEEPALFTRIEQAVEAALLAVPPIEAPDQRIEGISGRHRERLALKQVDGASVHDDPDLEGLARQLSAGWIKESTDALRTIRRLWQETQRLSIGGSYDLVSLRLSDEMREVAEKFGFDLNPETLHILNDYVANVLDQLVDSSIQLWLPMAETINAEGFQDPAWPRPAIKRLSMAMAIPDEPELKTRAEIVFAKAALAALGLQDVRKANRFASIAVRADELERPVGRGIEGFDLELKYLSAVTHRLLINTVDSHLRKPAGAESWRSAARGIDQVKNNFERASTLLQECLAWHHRRASESYEDSVRYLRALSERASLHLFIATSLGLRHPDYAALAPGDAERYLEIARGDLRRCIDYDLTLKQDNKVLSAVRNQFIPNIAGYETLAFLIAGEEAYRPEEWRRRALNRVWDFWQSEPDLHPLLTAELFTLALLRGRAPPTGKQFRHESHIKSMQRLRLPLDLILTKAIYRRILRDRLKPVERSRFRSGHR